MDETISSLSKRSILQNFGDIFSSLFGGKNQHQNNAKPTTTKPFDLNGLFNNILNPSMNGLQEAEDVISNIHDSITSTVQNLGKDVLGFMHESAHEISMFFERVKSSRNDFKNLMYVFGMFRTFSYMVPHEFNLEIDLKNYKGKLYERFERMIDTIEEASVEGNSTQSNFYVFWDLIQPEFRVYMLKKVNYDLNSAVVKYGNLSLNWANIPESINYMLNSSFAKKISELENDVCPIAKKIGKLLEKVSFSMTISIDKIKANYFDKMNQNLVNLANNLTSYELDENDLNSNPSSQEKYHQNYHGNDILNSILNKFKN